MRVFERAGDNVLRAGVLVIGLGCLGVLSIAQTTLGTIDAGIHPESWVLPTTNRRKRKWP